MCVHKVDVYLSDVIFQPFGGIIIGVEPPLNIELSKFVSCVELATSSSPLSSSADSVHFRFLLLLLLPSPFSLCLYVLSESSVSY